MRWLRTLLVILIGVALAAAILFFFAWLSLQASTVPADFDSSNSDAVTAALAEAEIGGLLLLLLGWVMATLFGTWAAGRLSGRAPRLHGIMVGFFILGFCIYCFAVHTHPIWFWIITFVFIVLATRFATRMARRQFFARRRRRAGNMNA